jgi:hypothetical protein
MKGCNMVFATRPQSDYDEPVLKKQQDKCITRLVIWLVDKAEKVCYLTMSSI